MPDIPLGVLDLIPISSSSTAPEALRNSIELARRAEEPFEGETGRDAQAVGGPAGDDRGGRGQRGRRPAARAAQAQVEAAGVQRVEQAELLDRGQRGAVAELYGAGAEPDGGGRGSREREDDRG